MRATTINDEMKIAAAYALAELAREDVPDEVAAAYHGNRPTYGPNYIIPVPFDPRLISHVPPAVAKAAIGSGVARKPIVDMKRYQDQLKARLDPSAGLLQMVMDRVRAQPRRVVFAEGEEEAVIRAAIAYQNVGLGQAILVGRENLIRETLCRIGADPDPGLEIHNARLSKHNPAYVEMVYKRLQRRGFLHRDAQRLVNQDRNIFGASMVAAGHADAMVTGVTRNYSIALRDISRVIDPRPGQRVIGVSVILSRGRTVFVADTTVTEMPTASELADIAEEAACVARRFGYEPRVALLSYSTFGHPQGERAEKVREAVRILDERRADFEYDGEMAVDVALNPEAKRTYPFMRLTAPANVLVMPAIHSASIGTKLLQMMGGCTVLGPLLVGTKQSVQISSLNAPVSELVNLAALAAFDISETGPC